MNTEAGPPHIPESLKNSAESSRDPSDYSYFRKKPVHTPRVAFLKEAASRQRDMKSSRMIALQGLSDYDCLTCFRYSISGYGPSAKQKNIVAKVLPPEIKSSRAVILCMSFDPELTEYN